MAEFVEQNMDNIYLNQNYMPNPVMADLFHQIEHI